MYLQQYDRLNQEADKVHNDIERIIEMGKAILPTVSEADKLMLSEKLNSLKDKHAHIALLVKDRSDALKSQLQQYKEAAAKLADSVNYMTEIQKELKELNRPVGSKIEDVQGMLGSYEVIITLCYC